MGFELDTEYLGGLLERFLGQLLVVPPAIGRVSDLEAHRYVTLRYLAGRRDLRLISVWNPTFLTRLVDALSGHADRLIDDVRRGTLTPPAPLDPALQAALAGPLVADARRADELGGLLREGGGRRLAPSRVWPELALISCWTSASSRLFLPAIEAEFPGVEIQGKGLLATEGFVSFPLCGHPGSALALDSHFLELVPVGGTRALLAGEAEIGGRYTVLLTTGGGLYRYALGDEVEVVDLVANCPLIRFLGRRGNVSDLCGEKLVDSFVDEALGRVLGRAGVAARFSLLAPEAGETPRYVLFLETPGAIAPELAEDLDRELSRNPQYGYCRRLGQLGPPQIVRVEDGVERYLAACQERGQRAGSIKPAALRKELDWRARLALPAPHTR